MFRLNLETKNITKTDKQIQVRTNVSNELTTLFLHKKNKKINIISTIKIITF